MIFPFIKLVSSEVTFFIQKKLQALGPKKHLELQYYRELDSRHYVKTCRSQKPHPVKEHKIVLVTQIHEGKIKLASCANKAS